MEPIHERIEDFIRRWRSRYEGNRVFRVLAVAVAIVLALLVLRKFRVLAAWALIGAIVVVGWLLIGPLLTIPRFTTEGPVVRDGVAAVVVCGKKSAVAGSGAMGSFAGLKGLDAAMEYVPEPRTGGWWPVRSEASDCTVWYHRPPEATQRFNRHERAQQEGYSP